MCSWAVARGGQGGNAPTTNPFCLLPILANLKEALEKMQCVFTYKGYSKNNEIWLKNFTSDNLFLIKFWLLTFSTMEILNPKVGTMQKKFEKYLWLTHRPAHFFRNWKSCLFWPALLNNNKIYLKTVEAENNFQIYAEKIALFYICIKIFQTQLKWVSKQILESLV